jgi:hypothetical protein
MEVIACAIVSQNNTKIPVSSSSDDNRAAKSIIWTELLQKAPFPHTAPLPPQLPTVLDGFYTKFDPKETPPVPCRRCPDYVPEGGIWKLNLDKGIFQYILAPVALNLSIVMAISRRPKYKRLICAFFCII